MGADPRQAGFPGNFLGACLFCSYKIVFERVPMKNELNQTALILLGKACLHGLVSEEHLFQKLGNDSSVKSITSIIPEEAPLEHSRQIQY